MPDQPDVPPRAQALHRPLTVCGVDRRLFFLALLMGGATFNLFYSFLAGVLVFLRPLWLRAVGDEPRSRDAAIILASSGSRRRYDPGEARAIRRGGGAW